MSIFSAFILTGNAQTNRIEALDYRSGKPIIIEITGGRITKIKKAGSKIHPIHYAAPGLIDNQVNGFAGVSFGFGNNKLDQEGIRKVTRELWKRGVTTYFPTLTTNSQEVILRNLSLLAATIGEKELYGSIAGYHIEGPYISPEDGYRGAHPLQYVRKPNWDEFMQLYKKSGSGIKTITVAPEIDGALEFIKKCTDMGIVVALGHHNATTAVINQAVQNGARISTHLGNGCANMINRHVNPLWGQMANDRLIASIICDGFHLRDEEIQVFYKVKGTDGIIITSDVTGFAGLPPGEYKNEEGETIELTPEGMLRYPSQNVLYGSASPISIGVVHLMKVTGCSLGDAISMASTNPAKLYGLNDRGSLEPGKRADIILFTIGNRELDIKKTFVAGNIVYEKN